jgi:hypothetical protein
MKPETIEQVRDLLETAIDCGEMKYVEQALSALSSASQVEQTWQDACGEFEDLLATYWNLAFDEGQNDTSHGDQANEILHSIRQLFNARNAASQPESPANHTADKLKMVQPEAPALTALREVREALQFANDTPNGPIRDTIWMFHRPETLFDYIDSILSAPAQAAAEPKSEWRCFHCDESFTDEEQAALHFGTNQYHNPACQVDAKHLRELESELARYREEDTDLHRQIWRMQAEHHAALRREEEKGYARGLADASPDAQAIREAGKGEV